MLDPFGPVSIASIQYAVFPPVRRQDNAPQQIPPGISGLTDSVWPEIQVEFVHTPFWHGTIPELSRNYFGIILTRNRKCNFYDIF